MTTDDYKHLSILERGRQRKPIKTRFTTSSDFIDEIMGNVSYPISTTNQNKNEGNPIGKKLDDRVPVAWLQDLSNGTQAIGLLKWKCNGTT